MVPCVEIQKSEYAKMAAKSACKCFCDRVDSKPTMPNTVDILAVLMSKVDDLASVINNLEMLLITKVIRMTSKQFKRTFLLSNLSLLISITLISRVCLSLEECELVGGEAG